MPNISRWFVFVAGLAMALGFGSFVLCVIAWIAGA